MKQKIYKAVRAAEDGLLLIIAGLTVAAAGLEIVSVVKTGRILLADLLLLFLYTEVLAMVGIFYVSRTVPRIYPVFIAITAVARLLLLQSKEMEPAKILFEAGAILLLAIAIWVLRKTEGGEVDSTPDKEAEIEKTRKEK